MGIDKFGRSVSSSKNISTPVYVNHQCIPITKFNNYDIQNKKLCNVQQPSEAQDAANKAYVDHLIVSTTHEINSKILHVEDKLSNKIIDEVNNTVATKSNRIQQAFDIVFEELKGKSAEYNKSLHTTLQESIGNNQKNIKTIEDLLSSYNIVALTNRLEKLEVIAEKRKITPQAVNDDNEYQKSAKKSKPDK